MATTEQEQKGKFLIVDGNGLAYRAFYSVLVYRSAQGLPVNAICGFIKLLFNVLYAEAPSYVCVAFDHSALTEHLLKYQGYNVQREQLPEELSVQLSIIEDFVHACGIKTIRMPGFEADDCIGTMVRRASEAGLRSLIVSGDLDLLQLVAPNVRVLTMRRGLSDNVVYNEDMVLSEFHLPPNQLASLRALAGDSGQNIPGIPGVGNVTARRLLTQYQNLDNLYQNLDRLPAKWRTPLREYQKLTYEYLKQATIRTDLPLKLQVEDCRFKGIPVTMFSRVFALLGTGFEFGPIVLERLHNMAIPEEISPVPETSLVGDEAREALRQCVAATGSVSVVALINREEERGIGIAYDGNPAFCISCEGGADQLTFAEIMEFLRPVFADSKRRKYVFGYQYLSSHYDVPGENILGVALASALLCPELWGHRFEEICSRFGLFTYDSLLLFGDGSVSWEYIPEANKAKWMNCAAQVLTVLGPKIEEALREAGLWDMYWSVDVPLANSLSSLLRQGMRFDTSAAHRVREIIEEQKNVLRERIYREAGYVMNLDDDRDLGELLFAKLNLLVPTRPKLGEPIGTNILVALEGQHELVTEVRKYRELCDFVSVFVEKFVENGKLDFDVTGSLFNLALIAERRLQLLNKIAVYGPALVAHRLEAVMDNILSADMRDALRHEMYRAVLPLSEDHRVVAVKFPQLSLHLLAHLSGDEALKNSLNDADVCAQIAKDLFGIEADCVSPHHLSTVSRLMYFYMGSHWLARHLLISEEEAEELRLKMVDYFNRHFPVSMRYLDQKLKQAENWEKLTTLAGRGYAAIETQSRMGPIRACARRRAVAFAMEGSVADFLRLLVARLFDAFGREVEMYPVFDSVVINVRKEQLDEVMAKFEELCRNNELGVEVPVVWQVGANLSEASSGFTTRG